MPLMLLLFTNGDNSNWVTVGLVLFTVFFSIIYFLLKDPPYHISYTTSTHTHAHPGHPFFPTHITSNHIPNPALQTHFP